VTIPEQATEVKARFNARSASRLFSAGLAVSTGTVLGLAAWLQPSPLGHGTHTQLGLGSCSFLVLTGYPCPMCGMTTTFSLMAHFHPVQALLNQPFGVVLFSMTLGAFSVAVAEAIAPRDRWTRLLRRLGPYESPLATLFLIGMGLGWLYKIAAMKGLF
jgi:hypothetical protein